MKVQMKKRSPLGVKAISTGLSMPPVMTGVVARLGVDLGRENLVGNDGDTQFDSLGYVCLEDYWTVADCVCVPHITFRDDLGIPAEARAYGAIKRSTGQLAYKMTGYCWRTP